jgi:hypothetical protein
MAAPPTRNPDASPVTTHAAEIVAIRHYGGVRTARVMCTYCGRTHLHRHPVGDTALHDAHCGQGTYRLGTPP